MVISAGRRVHVEVSEANFRLGKVTRVVDAGQAYEVRLDAQVGEPEIWPVDRLHPLPERRAVPSQVRFDHEELLSTACLAVTDSFDVAGHRDMIEALGNGVLDLEDTLARCKERLFGAYCAMRLMALEIERLKTEVAQEKLNASFERAKTVADALSAQLHGCCEDDLFHDDGRGGAQ